MSGAADHELPQGRAGLIEIKLSSVAQLFNSFDPSPFHEKDLDDDAEEYIVGTARECPASSPLTLMLYLPFESAATADVVALQESIRNYFHCRVDALSRELRETLRIGRTRLLIGLAFLLACTSIYQMLADLTANSTVTMGMREGLVVAGWVALWGPLQTFLYDWWPIVRRRNLYRRLSRMHVVVRAV